MYEANGLNDCSLDGFGLDVFEQHALAGFEGGVAHGLHGFPFLVVDLAVFVFEVGDTERIKLVL